MSPVTRERAEPAKRGQGGARVASSSYMFTAMYWPLIGGFVAFVLVAILLGWIMDTSRHGGGANHDS